jgi:hypothetical protein
MHWAEADTIMVSGNVTGINIGVVAGQFNGVATLHGILKTTKPLAKTDATSGLPGANVYLQSSTGSIVSFATTDQNGSYSLPGVPAGNYALLTEKAGYASPSNSVSVSSLQYTATVSDITIDPVVATAVSELHSVPTGFVLGQNYPNPFNPTTVIQYSLPAQGMVSMVLYNVLGQEVATLASGVQTAGVHQVIVDGKGLASGVYFYRLSTGANTETRRMVLLK